MWKRLAFIVLITSFYACGQTSRGPAGPPGKDGVPCAQQAVTPGDVVLPYGGSIITCSNATVLLSNGAPGLQGQPGPTATTPILEVMNPCQNATPWHEVFLRLSNGTLLASFSDDVEGRYTRLSVLLDGYNLMTTDHTGCTFDLTTQDDVRTIHYHNGSSESWQIHSN